jgi:hypothetical protein
MPLSSSLSTFLIVYIFYPITSSNLESYSSTSSYSLSIDVKNRIFNILTHTNKDHYNTTSSAPQHLPKHTCCNNQDEGDELLKNIVKQNIFFD